MKESYFEDNTAQEEALLNEFKGNLFEFILAHKLARQAGVEAEFLSRVNVSLRNRLSQYEGWLRSRRPDILNSFPALSESFYRDFTIYLQDKLCLSVENIKMIDVLGKLSEQEKSADSYESDILIKDRQGELYPVSLKLCKDHAYVNTKSGGVKSFLERYFAAFSNASQAQSRLDQIVDLSFDTMTVDICESAGLTSDWNDWVKQRIKGQGAGISKRQFFESFWQTTGLSSLPGQLPQELREIVQASYRPVINAIHKEMYEFYRLDSELFYKCLLPLLGFSSLNMNLAICFYSKGVDGGYKFSRSVIMNPQDYLLRSRSFDFKANLDQVKISSFEILFEHFKFQVRIKPMNRFTTAGHKVNCSVRYGDHL